MGKKEQVYALSACGGKRSLSCGTGKRYTNSPLHIGIIDYDHDPQYNEAKNFLNYYIAADDQTLKELTARTNLLQENELDSWQDALDSDDYISMYVNAYSDHIDVFLDYKDKEYHVPLTDEESQRLIEAMKKAGMDIQKDLQLEAYRAYKDNWIEEHISNEVMEATKTAWENDNMVAYENDEEAKGMTFTEYVEEYGFSNGEIYASFSEFLDNEHSTENAISDIYQATYACFKEIVDPSIKSGEFKRGDCKIFFSRESGVEDFTEVYYKKLPLCTIYKQGENFVIKPSTTDVSQNDLQKVKAAIDDTYRYRYNPPYDICRRKTDIERD